MPLSPQNACNTTHKKAVDCPRCSTICVQRNEVVQGYKVSYAFQCQNCYLDFRKRYQGYHHDHKVEIIIDAFCVRCMQHHFTEVIGPITDCVFPCYTCWTILQSVKKPAFEYPDISCFPI